MGTGTFGRVFECNDYKHQDIVAVKVIRNIKKYTESALIEYKRLREVNKQEKSSHAIKRYCVKVYTKFFTMGHLGLVFEPLGKSLYDIIKMNDYSGFPMHYVVSFSYQLLSALSFLKSMFIIHTDLKLENILMTPGGGYMDVKNPDSLHPRSTISIPCHSSLKIIDFGGATYNYQVIPLII